jgi:hypothetical protein
MNRRKPSKADFNSYFYLIKNLHFEGGKLLLTLNYSNELVYFSDNPFNMFKLLDDKKWRKQVINELEEHIGKQAY